MVSKSSKPINVGCVKVGYADKDATHAAGLNGMVFGNLLIGGLIGVVVDVASGAVNQYPNEVTVQLAPVEVAPAAQDSFIKLNPPQASLPGSPTS